MSSVIHSWAEIPKDRTKLSSLHPGFVPLVAQNDAAFEKIFSSKTIEDFRAGWAHLRGNFPTNVPSSGYIEDICSATTAAGREILLQITRPAGTEGKDVSNPLPVLFVLHGGGWVGGSHATEAGMIRTCCVRNNVIAISVDYRRAPEHPYPAAIEDAVDAYYWMIAHAAELRIDASRIFFGGSSAGANLIAALVLRLRDEKALPHTSGQMLNIPATCHPDAFPGKAYILQSYEDNASAPTINAERMRWYWDQYVQAPSHSDPTVSPLLAKSHEALPPTLIQVGGADPLRDEGIAYAQVLQRASVPVTIRVYPGMPHGFLLAGHLQESEAYFNEMSGFLQSRLDADGARY